MTGEVGAAERPWRDDVRAVAWWVAVAAAVGGVVGLIVGGAGGRLLMLALRLGSDDVDGVTSDDGFAMGRFSSQTLDLLAFATTGGVLFAGFYVLVRGAVPASARIPGAALFAAVAGGAAFLNPGGVDLQVLEPTWLAVAGFVALPGLAGLLIAAGVERAAAVAPWSVGHLALLALAPAVGAIQGLVAVVLGGLVAVGVRHLVASRAAGSRARRVVVGGLVALLALAALGLADDLRAIDWE